MAVRTALKRTPHSGAKRDHARSGSTTSSRVNAVKSRQVSTPKKSLRTVFARRKRSPQSSQTQRKTSNFSQKITKFFLTVAGGVVIVGLLIFLGYFVYIPSLFTPNTSRFVALVPETTDAAETAVYVVWLGPSEAESKVWELPASVSVDLPESYGEYRLGSVYPLLNMDKRSAHFVDAVLTRSVHVVIEGHLVLPTSTKGQPLSARVWQHGKNEFRRLALTEAKTAAQIWYLTRQSSHHQQLQTVAELQQQVKKLQKGAYPAECSVAILNASETAGEATALSQVIELNGITAIRVDTYPVKQAESNLYVQPGMAETCQSVITVLQKVFTLSEGIVAEENTQITNQYHAPIVVVAGERF